MRKISAKDNISVTNVLENKTKSSSEINLEVSRLIDKISKKYKKVWQDLSKV